LTPVGQWHARAHARRPLRGRFVCPTLDDVVAKIPAGYRPVLDQAAARARFADLPGTTWLRSDSHATRWAVWRALVDFMGEDGLAVVGQDRIAERASHHRGHRVARTTAGNHLRALAADCAVYVDPGASKEVLGADRDRASVYVVLTPDVVDQAADVALTAEQLAEVDRLAVQLAGTGAVPVDGHGHLPEGSTPTRGQEITQPRKNASFPSSAATPADEIPYTSAHAVLGSSPSERPIIARREHPERYAARTGPERDIAVAWIAGTLGLTHHRRRFAPLTSRELRKITGPFFAAGWSPAAVVRALRVQPDGIPWPGPLPTPDQRDSRDQPRIRNLWAVLTHRLSAWRDQLGCPLDPPIPSDRPRRGRPPKPPAPRALPPAPIRGTQAEADVAAWRARDNQRRAAQAAAAAARQARLSLVWQPRPPGGDQDQVSTGPPTAAYLRAQLERRRDN
jgi:hypothetical protein